MKQITNYINEKLHITTKSHLYSCHPKTKRELRDIIIQRIEEDGPKCDLNDIDVSKITDMSYLFNANPNHNNGNDIFKDFNGDISQWDVSKVTNMKYMFNYCEHFNCDISQWDVSNVTNMDSMFVNCGRFNQDLNEWDVSKVKNMVWTFFGCSIYLTTPKWYKYRK